MLPFFSSTFTPATHLYSFVLALSLATFASAATSIPVTVPARAPGHNVVQSNFLGISIELSFMSEYFGNDTSTIPPTILTYLSGIRNRTGNSPLRIRVGGNSMDDSTYVPNLTGPMIQFITTSDSSDDQPVNYGPMLWQVMKQVADNVGGAEYLIGLSLRDPNNMEVPVIAADAEATLGTTLDGYLLGNVGFDFPLDREPDLYTTHGQRPNIKNYTTDIYISEYQTVTNRMTNTSAGDLLDLKNFGGPTICCFWNLDALLTGGYLSTFDGILKYVTLQHYPQNNCFGSYAFGIPYYIQHANAVTLAAWQSPAISLLQSNTSANRPQLIMSEFNSASCGGIPTVSDTFAVGTLWTLDYSLQMAAAGYSAAYVHTRERGISYNLFTPPDAPNGSPGDWVTNPPYYAVVASAEALQTTDGTGGVVVDLNISNSITDKTATVAGYAVYDSNGANVEQFVLFNYANVSNFATADAATATFALPASAFTNNKKTGITVKFLSAASLTEKYNIAWGGQSLVNVGDGVLQNVTASWAVPNQELDCTNGCSVNVPAAAMAVVFAGGTAKVNTVNPTTNTTASSQNSGTQKPNQDNQAWRSSATSPLLFVLCALGALFVSGL
ncbi:hypothetical protein H0H93_000073 [Arthromyces matolae]|nr:hypothetical protein H0H93_000073 [Arthromyces matolae]